MQSIRRGRADEAGEVRALVRAAFAVYVPRMGREPAPMGADYAAAIAAGKIWVAEDEGRLAGVLMIEYAPDHLYLDTLAVAPGEQRRGVGTALLAFAEEQARQAGLAEVRLFTNELMIENLTFYPRHGYTEVTRGEWNGYRRVQFARTITKINFT